jgi:pimeloyl-ACP methyl ester carboxylesterase
MNLFPLIVKKEMEKTPVYFMPGLAADSKVFENLTLDKEKYTIYYLNWILPLTIDEDIAAYALRLSEEVKEKDAVLIGVSFGGIIVQELAQFVNPKKIIIISSVKHEDELPKRFKYAKVTKVYKLFPTKIIENFEDYLGFFLGKSLKKRADLYNKYLSVRSEKYLKWAVRSIIKWEQKKPNTNITHIHGTNDAVFPMRNIKNSIEIKEGTHIMILTKAKKISKIIDRILTC